MTLKEYKKKYKLTYEDLASLFGVSVSCMGHWLGGHSKPNIHHAAVIFKKTKGEVTLQDLWN